MIGQTVSHYKITEKLGEGGMGVVYKAQDTKLDRFVALKFLPDRLSESEQDRARFIQEAKAASALSHPNVRAIYDIGEFEKQLYIVMECIEGQTLTDIGKNMPLKRALDISIQIADGLAAAHEKGIVHRDIKPDNIMVRKDGLVQIMDFGLAKLQGASRMTREGTTLGTVGYMSPEQVQGLDTDHRSDIFSLGVLMYELLTGELPFKGVHETALMYEIVNVDVAPPSSVNNEIEPELDRIILECLEKELGERMQTANQVSADLKRYKRESGRQRTTRVTAAQAIRKTSQKQIPAESFDSEPMTVSNRSRIVWIAAMAVTAIIGYGLAYLFMPRPETKTLRASFLPPAGMRFQSDKRSIISLSPDGTTLAFAALDSSGKRALWIQKLRSSYPQRLAGTEGAELPFWAPDNRFLGFFAEGKLKKIDITGGSPLAICDAPFPQGGTWNSQGQIVFAPNQLDILYEIASSGGIINVLTVLDESRSEKDHNSPCFLPDGKHILYFAASFTVENKATDGIYLGALDSDLRKFLISSGGDFTFANGYIIYRREGSLIAQAFDEDKLELRDNPFPICDDARNDPNVRTLFTASNDGLLLYETANAQSASQLVITDRAGVPIRSFDFITNYSYPALSHDGKKIAVDIKSAGNSDIWIYDTERNLKTRFTFDQTPDLCPVWTRDDKAIAFTSNRKGVYDIYIKTIGNSGGAELLVASNFSKLPTDWSGDGRHLVYNEANGKTKNDLMIFQNFGEKQSLPFLQTPFEEYDGRISPDGRWLAYTSLESGKENVYVTPFPNGDGKWQVSTDGGWMSRWRKDGKELYYIDEAGRLTAVEVDGSGPTFKQGTTNILFQNTSLGVSTSYDVSADGQRFLFVTASRASVPLTMIINWPAEIRR